MRPNPDSRKTVSAMIMTQVPRALLTLCLLLAAALTPAQAQNEHYIRDELYVPLRSGASQGHKIIQMLRSGTPLTVQERNQDWTQVRTREGKSGWLETQYLTDTPVAADLLASARRERDRLQEQNRELRQQLQDLREQHGGSESQLEELSQRNRELSEELDEIKEVSANAIKLDRDNQKLLEANEMLRNQLEVVQTDNQRLRDSQENEAFLNGAIAVVIGVMIALVVPRLWPKRKSEWA